MSFDIAEESQADVLRRYAVDVVDLRVTYARKSETGRAQVFDGRERFSVEEYVSRHCGRDGWNVLPLESSPLHVLFGVYMWPLIQDADDDRVRMVCVADKRDVEARTAVRQVWFPHPEDFGTPGYGVRRAHAIAEHLSLEMLNRDDLRWVFDFRLEASWTLRNYLWAHKEADVRAARQLVETLPPAAIVEILKYLAEDYWGRYLGWPDLLVWRSTEFFLAEVKSSGDKLSENQKRWIRDNAERLKLPFRLVKLHKVAISD